MSGAAISKRSLLTDYGQLTTDLSLEIRHLERFAFGGSFDPAAADALDTNPLAPDGAVDLHLDALKVRAKRPPADARDLPADAAQILGLAAPGDLMSQARFLPTNATL